MASEESSAAERTAQSVTALYVGDLDRSVTEDDLRRLFDRTGDVFSVKICTDHITEEPLGYGYVNYSNPLDAAKALENLNFAPLKGKCIRIAYSNRDAALRQNGVGNLFVKNLDKGIDHKALHEIFSPFGNIISSKVETDASGHSKGYGYVHYDIEESAKNAIEQLNGLPINGKELYVGPFINKQDREASVDRSKFTNVFVKNLSDLTTEDDLKTIFGEFGSITSVAVIRDEGGSSKCFGFVNFENSEDAVTCVDVLNGRVHGGKEWYVGRAQKKSERERELKIRHERIQREALERSLGLNNLYIKNLDEDIDDDKLKEVFSPFGTITSCKVMRDPKGISKGAGFVAFSTRQEASRAISEMKGKMVGSKPLYVAIAEKKEARTERLQALFSGMPPNAVLPSATPRMAAYTPGGPGVGQQIFCGQAHPAVLLPPPGFGHQQFTPSATPAGPVIANALTMGQQGSQVPRPDGRRPVGDGAVQPSQRVVPMMYHQMLARETAHRPRPAYAPFNISAPGTASMVPFVHEINPSPPLPERRTYLSTEALASALENASPAEQRTILGEKLYPLVEQLENEMAPKVTGMLLEMDYIEVLHLLESPESLRAKVEEAMEVLRTAPQLQANDPAEQLASLVLNE